MGIAKRYFNSIVKVFCATCIMGFGIALFIACELGSDPVTVFLDGFHRKTGIAVSVTDEVLNLIILTLALLCNRKKAGICTIVCVLISGFCVQIPTTLIEPLHLANRSILVRLIGLGIGQVCLAIAYAWTQTFNDGINALDCVFFKVIKKTQVQYHTIRILYDGTFITIGFLLGGIVGVGTIISLATTGILVEILKNRMDTIIKWKENYSEGKVKKHG